MAKKTEFPNLLKTISDLFVRYLFSSQGCEPITRSFINAVMTDAKQPPIVRVDIRSPFNLETYQAEKESILDVLAEDEAKKKFHIEVQVLREDAFIERCLYYNSKIYSTQLIKGEDYTELKPVISIVLTAYDLFPDSDRLHTSFLMTARENPGQILSDHLQIHFLQMPKKSDDSRGNEVNGALLKWLKFFNYPAETGEIEFRSLGNEDEGLKMAIHAFDTFQNDPVLQDLARRREKFLLDVTSARNTAVRQAKAEGIAIGEARGESRGEIKGKLDTLFRILTKRLGPLPEDLTAKLTALTDVSEIDRLADIALDVPTLDEFVKVLS